MAGTTTAAPGRTSRPTARTLLLRSVQAVVLLAALALPSGLLSLPAHAHHKSSHAQPAPSTSTAPEKSPTSIAATSAWYVVSSCSDLGLASACDPYGSWVQGSVYDSSGRWLAGLTVTVTADFGTSTQQRTATFDEFGQFSAKFSSDTPPLTWTAVALGDSTHHGSQATDYFRFRSPSLPDTPCVGYAC